MGDPKLCLLLLLSTSALAFAQNDDQPTCLLARRYKTLQKYEYRYEAESLNAITGASAVKNGPKASCTVVIEVPQACSFVVRTTRCQLTEVVDTDMNGNPVFGPAPTSDVFAADMERYPLKVVVGGMYDVKLYPEDGETTTILNVKRGIISALAVPLMEGDRNKIMPTIHGKCNTQYTINSRRSIVTDISLNRDLSECDKFVPIRDHTSPLALISGMHYPLAQLIRSSQSCNYKFDDKKKHMVSGSCTEKHILVPFSHNGDYGVTSVGRQELTLVKVTSHNDRIFSHSGIQKELHMESVEDKSTVQNKDAVLSLLRDLAELDETNGEKRARLFRQLVTVVRGMRAAALRAAIPEAVAVSRLLTYQVLAQCGTPDCSSAILQILRMFDVSSMEVDAGIFAMAFVSNPSPLLINDMLEMAQYRRSKTIMYALSNTVKRFFKAEEKLIPEIYSVAEFMAAQLGDCSGDKDDTFMTLRVIGNMAPAVIPASPALRAAVIQCVNQPAAHPVVQQAAIQAFRLISVPEEGRGVLLKALMDSSSPMQKRVAAYLMLMKEPRSSELAPLLSVLSREFNPQFRSFVESHLINIVSSTEPEMEALRFQIRNVLQGNEIGPIMDPTRFSRNYKMGSVEGNMIFEEDSYLPKEVMLEMTLKAFGYDIDMLEIGMEGKGFEPTVEALFGPNGFLPDTVLKTMYYVSDSMPQIFSEILKKFTPSMRRDRVNTQNFIKDFGQNVNKLVREVTMAESPEAMVYLRLLGNELGYLTTTDMSEAANSAVMWIGSLVSMFQTDLIKMMTTKTDNTVFAHYIFMDNEFFLPTVTGMPLKVSLSGTFTPGIKGGLMIARDMGEISFMPSAGVEFLTQVGSQIPEYVSSGLEMHTNIFHESGLRAKVSMGQDSVKLAIPAPNNPTKLFKITNNLVAVTGSQMMPIIPMVMDMVDVNKCTPFFTGMRYCTSLQYVDAFSQDSAPYFPFTGDSKFAMELHPTGEVTEYTATITYELLKEGDDGRQKVDSVSLVLRAEGADPTEARGVMKYNRKKHVVTADVQIPDYDVEAGVRLGIIDGNTKGKGTHSITLDFVNKDIPQLSLVARANLKAMKEGMLQLQLLVPSVDIDATLTANMRRGQQLELELKSEVKVMEIASSQQIKLDYDARKITAEFKSDINTDTSVFPNSELLEKYGNEILDLKVGETDMKVRHIFKKFVEAANNYLEKYGADFPYIQNFRVPDMPEISLPEILFINAETKAVYYFNNQRYTFSIPLPLGGKSADDLGFPLFLKTPSVSQPEFGLNIVSMEVPVPRFVVPKMVTLSIPLFGKAEASALLKSNLYDMEASASVGKDVGNTPSYSAKFDVTGTSPLDILSVKFDGSGMLATAETIKAQVQSSLVHKFIDATLIMTEDASVTDKINLRSERKIEAKSPLGLNFKVEHNCVSGIKTEEFSADSSFKGMIMAGPLYGKTTSTQSFTISPFQRAAKIDSNLELDSTIMQAKNTFIATIANGEMSVLSNTKAFEDMLNHAVELSYKGNKLSFKQDATANTLGMRIHNQAEASAGAGKISMRTETSADHFEGRANSLVTVGLDVNGLAVNSDHMLKVADNEATHNVTLKMNKDGLVFKGTSKLLSPLALENTIDVGYDASGASLSITNMAEMDDNRFDNVNRLTITLSSLDFTSKAEAIASEVSIYTHDAMITMKPYTASATLGSKLMIWTTTLINEAKLQAEPNKIDLTGLVKATNGQEEVKYLYQASYADLTANFKSSTSGKLFGTHMSYNNELEVIGLAAKLTNDFRFNSQAVRYDHTIRCSAVPFDFNLDAIVNADGDVTMYGTHSGQLYGKVLLKAQPLAFASTHECRASVTQQLDNGFALKTTFDNKIDNVLSLQEQRTNVRMKTKVNEHAFIQLFAVYNKAELAGIEASSSILTNVFNIESNENQDFSISGFIKYDKNTQSQVIELPLMESLPAFLEHMKALVVTVAKSLQVFIKNAKIREGIEALPDYVTEFINQINIKGYLAQLNQIFDQFSQYTISMKDMEAFLSNLWATFEKMFADIKLYIETFAAKMREVIVSGMLTDAFILEFGEKLKALDAKYDIQATIVSDLDTMIKAIQEFDLEQFKGTKMQFLYEIESEYNFLHNLRMFLKDLKRLVERFEIKEFAEVVREIAGFVFMIFDEFIAEIYRSPPFEMIMDMKDYFVGIIQELNIPSKISTGYAQIREVIVKFEADKRVQVILQSAVELVKQFKIEETVRTVSKMVKDANIPATFMKAFQRLIKYLEINEIKYIIEDLNRILEAIVVKINSLQYNDIVNYANQYIAECTAYVNNLIRTLEVPQKLEATREFLNQVSFSVRGIVERFREIKVAEMIKSLKDVTDQLVFDRLRNFAELAKQKVADFDAKTTIPKFMEFVSECYRKVIEVTTGVIGIPFEIAKIPLHRQKFIRDITRIIYGIGKEVEKGELTVPSFVVPFTDLVMPSWTLSMADLGQIEIPTQLDIPAFTILDHYTVQATTVSIDDIKNKLIQLIDFFLNFDMGMPDVDAFFGDLTMNFLPPMPAVSFPEIPLPEFSFPSLPQVPVDKLVKSLQVPAIKLPTIPHELMVPCFGKLYGEFRFQTPIYNVKTSAELQNSTESEMTPSFTGFLTSQATSPMIDFLNYKLDTSARLAIPKMSRIVLAETLKLNNPAVVVEHQASVSLYGLSAQAQAKTSVKVNTTPYVGVFINTAFIAMEEGMSGSLDTTYSHLLNIPTSDVRNEVLATQKVIVRHNGYTVTLAMDNSGKGKHNAEDVSHKSNCQLVLTPGIVTLDFSGDTELIFLKMNQQVSAELGTLQYFKFNVLNKVEAPVIKNSLLVASGQGSLFDMKIDIKASHRADLFGPVTGLLSNELNIVLQPFEFVFEYLNKGNARFSVFKDLAANVDVQNDYSASFRPGSQQVNAVALLSLNQYRTFCNFTADNNENQAGVFVVMESEADLEILRFPIDIPSIDLPLVDFRTPAVTNLNLYDLAGLRNVLKSNQQAVHVDAKVVYQKSQEVPLAMIGMIQIPAVGNLLTELSFKSAFIHLNVNADMYTEDDLLIRLRGTTASDFDFLKAKLDGTTSLSSKGGVKLANSVSLENNHIEGTHESTFVVSAETFDAVASVTTAAKIVLPVLNVEATQTFVADTRTRANPVSTFTVKGDFNIPVIKAVGKAHAYCTMKLDRTVDFVSVTSETRASVNGTVLEDYAALGVVDNVLDFSLNELGLRSTSKIIANGKLYQDTTTIVGMDVNEKLAVEVSLSRVLATLEYFSNNEANLFNMNTNGKHLAKAKFDFTPVSFLAADIEIDLFQPSSVGEFTFSMKNVADVTSRVQKVSTIMGFSSPLYNTKMDAVAEGNAPVFKVTMKSSGSSVFTILDYATDVSSTVNLENEAEIMISKVTLAHSELNVDFTQALSSSQHTVNAAITGPSIAAVSFRYASGKDGISASASSPSAGFLGLQVNSRVPSQMTARVYSRYLSAPEVDVDVLAMRSAVKDDKTRLQIAYNMDVPRSMLLELRTRIPSVLSAVTLFADKYQITRRVKELLVAAEFQLDELYESMRSYDLEMSELSVFYRNTFVQYQKSVQAFIDAVVKVLRETKFKLPGSDELTTVPEVLKEVTRSTAVVLEKILQNLYASLQFYYDAYVEMIMDVNLSMPVGDVLASNQFFADVKKATLMIFMDLKNTESLDTMLVKVGETLKAVTEKTQEFVDSIESEYLDVVLAKINSKYIDFIFYLRVAVTSFVTVNREDLSYLCENIVDSLVFVTEQVNNVVSVFLQQTSEEVQNYVTVSGGTLEIELPLSFQQ